MPNKGLADLLNLGEKSAQMLHAAGIHTVEELNDLGAVEAYLRIKQQGIAVSFNMLYAIEGALTNTHWNKLDHATREALILQVDAIESDRS
jgi:DNA transformation protein